MDRIFKASKSSLTAFETIECRKRWFEEYVVKSVERDDPSDQMKKGLYFEMMAIGADVRGESEMDTSFLLTGKGAKSAEMVRIEEQAQRFKELFDPSNKDFLGFKIEETQVLIENKSKKTVIDFIATDDFGNPCVFDLKFTGDVSSTFGDYAWGRDPNDIDWVQMDIASDLFEEERGVKPRVFVIVFDASPRKGIKLFEIKLSELTKENNQDRIDLMMDISSKYLENGDAPVKPSLKNCEGCKVDCMFRAEPGIIETIKVNV